MRRCGHRGCARQGALDEQSAPALGAPLRVCGHLATHGVREGRLVRGGSRRQRWSRRALLAFLLPQVQTPQRINPQTREPTQRQPATRARAGAQRRSGHGLGDNGGSDEIGGHPRQITCHSLGFNATNRALDAHRVAHKPSCLAQGGPRPGSLTRDTGRLIYQMGGQLSHSLPRRRTDWDNASARQTTLIQDAAQVGHDGGSLSHAERVDMGQGNRHGGMRGAQAFQPLIVQARIRVLLRVNNDDKGVHTRGQTPGHLRV